MSPNTIIDYSRTLHKLTGFLGDRLIDQMSRFDIWSFLAVQTVGNKTLLNYHTGFSVFFKWLVNEKMITVNPMEGVERPRPEKRVIVPIPFEHIKRILAVADRSAPYQQKSKIVTNDMKNYGLRNRALILFLLDTGVRVGELITIEKDKLDHNSCSVKVIGKSNKERVIFFSPTTSVAVWKYASSHQS